MQSFFNPKTPFFDGEGHLLTNARVTFRAAGTSGEKITLRNIDGITLENPLFTGMDGKFKAEEIPYIEDGVSYKVTVERPTGVDPVYDENGAVVNDSECFETVDEFTVTASGHAGGGTSATIVYGIAGVRDADPSLGSVLCVGYNTKDDGTPSRTFTWTETKYPKADNGINILSGNDRSTGYWKMSESCDVVDVRIGGIFPENDAPVNDTRLESLRDAVYTTFDNEDCALYFPSGIYTFGMSHSMNCAILAKGSLFKSSSGTITMTVGHLENRGGKFVVGDGFDDPKIIPVIGGLFRSSWISGNIGVAVFKDEKTMTDIFENCGILIFDSFHNDDIVLDPVKILKDEVHLENKLVICLDKPPYWISIIRGNSVILDCSEVNGITSDSFHADSIAIGNLSIVKENGNICVYQNDVKTVSLEGHNIKFLVDGKVDFEGDVEVNKGIVVKKGGIKVEKGNIQAPNVISEKISCIGEVEGYSGSFSAVKAEESHSEITDFSSQNYRIAVVSSAIAIVEADKASIPALFPDSKAGDVVRVVHKKPCIVMLDYIGEATYKTKGIGLFEYFCWKDNGNFISGPLFVPVNCNSDQINLKSIKPDPLGDNSPWVTGGWDV
ncbi:MAG: hypothetical protein MJY87_02375 [Fibrobacter sp.]|nr:hypothetical protein [Fibrobacter sp.]